MILPDDDKGRAEGVFLCRQSTCNALDQTGFPGSQLAYQEKDVSVVRQSSQIASQQLSLFRAV